MKEIDCKDREQVLREPDTESMQALERHAQTCARCARELRMLNQISEAARGMHRTWESPRLWTEIEQALNAEAQAAHQERSGRPLGTLGGAWRRWQIVAALATVLVVSGLAAWRLAHRPVAPIGPEVQRRLLTEQAVREVEKSEAAYVASIQKLSALAAPKLQSPKTPLLQSYREKLLLLDDAIAECRAQAEQNRGNPELEQELLSMYQEKQRTLEQLIREE